MTVKVHEDCRDVAMRLRRPFGADFQFRGGEQPVGFNVRGRRRYLLPDGVPDKPVEGLIRPLFEYAANDVVRIDMISGAGGLPRGCQLVVLLFDLSGTLRERRRVPLNAKQLFHQVATGPDAGSGSIIIELLGTGEVGDLVMSVETGRPGMARRASAALERKDWREASSEIDDLERRQPHHPRLNILRARTAWLAKDYATVVAALRRQEKISPLDGPDRRRLVGALRRSGLLDQAEQAYLQLFEPDTTNAAALREWARLAEDRGEVGEAIRRWGIVAERTQATWAIERYDALLEASGEFEAAHRVSDQIETDDPAQLAAWARRLLDREQNATALSVIDRLVELAPASDLGPWHKLREATAMAAAEDGSSPAHAPVVSAKAHRDVRNQKQWIARHRHYAEHGLADSVIPELIALTRSDQHPVVRIEAHWALVGLSLAGRGHDTWTPLERLAAIETLRGWRPGLEAVHVRLLTNEGRLDRAEEVLNGAAVAYGNLLLAGADLARARDAKDVVVLGWINRALTLHELAPLALIAGQPLGIDALTSAAPQYDDAALVSVIVPMWNARGTIETALRSLTMQTHANIEILVVDDASPDDSAQIVEAMAADDPRITLLRNPENRGAYHSRNRGLAAARGEYFTCHDSDDWAHPQRIERQLRSLRAQDEVVGNMSRCLTAAPNLRFVSRDSRLTAYRLNISSLMLRREIVIDRVGYWDEARFGADGEYLSRLRAVFGRQAIAKPNLGPLAIVRQSATSLTGHGELGLRASGWTSRRIYRAQYEHWQERSPEALQMDRDAPPTFCAPAVIRGRPQNDQFDVVVASDFRLSGGTTASNVQEIRAQAASGLRTGLVQLDTPRLKPTARISPKILDLVEGDLVDLVSSDRHVKARHTVVRWPPAVGHFNSAVPTVTANAVSMIVNQTPWRGEVGGESIYVPANVDRHALAMFGHRPVWRPIGPAARAAMQPHRDEVLLADIDWVNILDLADWGGTSRARRPNVGVPVIGRHSRDFPGKWPMDPAALLAVYPDDGSMAVSILGGADVAARVLGREPSRWRVFPFDSIAPSDYLNGLDVFVYFPDPGLDEAFGRAIIEAMAAGVPVVLPHRFHALFGEAALYGEPVEARDIVVRLVADDALYARRSAAGIAFAEAYSHQLHLDRLKPLLGARPRQPASRRSRGKRGRS